MRVKDESGDIGHVIECDDIHNVLVKFVNKHGEGSGLYCLDESCDEYTPLFK